MIKVDAQTVAMREVSSFSTMVHSYAGSDSAQAMGGLLGALIDSYKFDLMYVAPEGLTRLQALIQQCIALRCVVTAETTNLPKI